uniref:PDZ domain-containing protein n=1 Tax=Arion vulgaris TaxID=1028688 RepID=A0A0B6ZLF6_9EUPU
MATGATECVQLRRRETSQAWGFKLQGGRDVGLPLFIVQVSPKGIAGKAGLQNGDAVLQICGTSVTGYSNQEAKSELMRAGNEVDLFVVRGAVNISDPAIKAQCGVGQSNKRVELDEGSINPHMNEGSSFRNVTPKSYKILEQQLGSSEPPASALSKQPAQPMPPVFAQNVEAKPSSIFDRKKQDRSDYLVAQGQSIQKTYGEQ